jgi:hypothetical protein
MRRKIEQRGGLPHTSTRSNDGEALRSGAALKALLTYVCVDKEQHLLHLYCLLILSKVCLQSEQNGAKDYFHHWRIGL